MNQKKEKRAPIHITLSDVERAYKKVEEFQRLIERGKTPEQIFKDMLRLIEVDK
ncbi:hypothetical protein LCGC14_0555930 [marine sediment metagenome]|uniref:Uncharacterized protein n=1 Tax=marine sediment metagenome TaxID=412755 RepID=A0A0F9S708_9ZZZZ|nr:MAG: hypothetical protein Lokiarch_49150 [Candidatus Lokiarchaeum sp. GC14_75]